MSVAPAAICQARKLNIHRMNSFVKGEEKMRCSVCGVKLKSGACGKCPGCGAAVPAGQKKKHTFAKMILLVVMLFAAVCVGVGISEVLKGNFADALYGCVFAGVFALAAWGRCKLGGSAKTAYILFCSMLVLGVMAVFEEGQAVIPERLSVLSGFVACVCIALVCWGIAKRDKKLIVLPVIAAAVFGMILVGAVNDVPYFIRRIQGEEFMGIWYKYCAVLWLVIIVCGRSVLSIYAKGLAKKASLKKYSDSDLMLLREFDRYQLVGYYLLKARLHNVIQYIKAEDGESANQIGLDDKMTDSERNVYCGENPQVGKIVAFITRHETATGVSAVGLRDVVQSVVPNPEFQSEGGRFAAKYISKVKHVIDWGTLAGIGATFYPAVTKLLMGQYNGKPVGNLMSGCAIVAMVLGWAWVSGLYGGLIREVFKRKFVGAIVRVKLAEFDNIEYLLKHTKIENSYVPNEGTEKLLRAYALCEYTLKDRCAASIENENIQIATMSAVVAAQAAAAEAARASSDSGCSSCSGCGGGCGGCGGCGE